MSQYDQHLPQYFTWDNLFDILLYNSVASQFVLHNDQVQAHSESDEKASTQKSAAQSEKKDQYKMRWSNHSSEDDDCEIADNSSNHDSQKEKTPAKA